MHSSSIPLLRRLWPKKKAQLSSLWSLFSSVSFYLPCVNFECGEQWSGRFLGIITDWGPNVCKSNRFTCWRPPVLLYKIGVYPKDSSNMIGNFPAVLMNFNRLFLKLNGSFVTNCRFSPIICGELEFTPSSCSCRMTQKLFVPVNYSFIARLPKFQTWSHVGGFVYKICGIFHVISSNPRIWWSLSTCQPCHSPNQSHLPAGQLERERGPGSPWKK